MAFRIIVSLAFIATVLVTAAAQVPVTGGRGVTLSDLVDSDTFVTVVLRSGGVAYNERIRTVGDTFIGTEDENGQPQAYPIRDIRELRVQLGRVQRPARITGGRGGARTVEDRNIEVAATNRAFQLFEQNKDKGQLLMQAAAVMAAGQGVHTQNALGFLHQRASSGDIPTAVEASLYLYLAGGAPDPAIIERGILSGIRQSVATAVRVAGLTGGDQFRNDIRLMLNDPVSEIFGAAAASSALLGDESAVPLLEKALLGLNEERAEAAVNALATLGGETVIQAMKELVESERGITQFRAIRVLHELGDEDVLPMLRPGYFANPLLELEGAIMLARGGDWDAILYVREAMDRPRDPNRENLILRARMAAALLQGGHPPAKGVLQELLRMRPETVYSAARGQDPRYQEETARVVKVTVCRLLAEIGTRTLLTALQPVIEHEIPEVAMAACEAAVAIANPEFGERLAKSRL